MQLAIEFQGQEVVLDTRRIAYFPAYDAMLLSDLHLGKVGHFRKNALAMPLKLLDENYHRLRQCFNEYKPRKVFFLGDLFHSKFNLECNMFFQFLEQFSSVEFHLIQGNHDILDSTFYKNVNLKVAADYTLPENIKLQHFPNVETLFGTICGHVHPGYALSGRGLQKITLPCFYHSQNNLILPAFGNFTGMHLIRPKKNEKVYCFTAEKFFPIFP